MALKFYRVSYSTDGAHGGYSWHVSKRAALAAARRDYRKNPAEYEHYRGSIDERVEVVFIKPTRACLLDVLTRYASHPDNG